MDDRYTSVTSVWLIIIPMLISVYIASLLTIAVFANAIDGFLFAHDSSNIRTTFIYGSIFIGFFVASFCISIAAYIAIPVYKKIFMVVVFFIPIIWPNIISLFLFGIENAQYIISKIDIELVVFVVGSILGGFIAYNVADNIESKSDAR